MTQSEIVILCLLNNKDYYGYEIDRIIEKGRMREWTEIGFSSIYNILNKLEKKELITHRFEKKHGSPRRKVYSILESGKEILHQELVRVISGPKEPPNEFNIGLVWSNYLSDQEFKNALEDYKKVILKKIEDGKIFFTEIAKKHKPASIVYERSLIMLKAELTWVEKILQS